MLYLPRRVVLGEATPTFRSQHFDIHPVGNRIWAAIGRPTSGATGNAGIVDLGGPILVFDTFLTMQASADLRSAAQFLTGQIPTQVVNSHGHLDHTLGNAAFGASTIHGTEATRQFVGKNGPEMLARAADP
ncbi:MAG TPA: MBL fold metallo-hydrolase, partial [Thermoplasmata archaeon]|nr:MBL fold metallo-hydrolase [Thermoplasmata archaeon]